MSPPSRRTPSKYRHWKLDVRRRRSRRSRWTSQEDARPAARLQAQAQLVRPRRRHRARRRDPAPPLRAPRGAARSSSPARKDRIFCAGANIYMLGGSTHAFKVNFCKFTNETRLDLEDASARTRGIKFLAALQRHRAPAAATSWRSRATRSSSSTTATRAVSACPRRRCSACCPAPAASPASSTSARCAATSPTSSARSPRACKGKRAVEWGLVDAVVADEPVRRRGREARAQELAAQRDRPASGPGDRARRRSSRRSTRRRRSSTGTSTLHDRPRDAHRRRSPCAAPDAAAADDAEAIVEAGAECVAAARVPRARRRAAATCASTSPTIGIVAAQDRRATPSAVLARRRDARDAPGRTGSCARSLPLHEAHAASASTSRRAALFALDRAGLVLRRHARSSSRSPPTASTCSTTTTRPIAIALSPMNGGPLPMANGLIAPADALPRRARARVGELLAHGRPLDAADGARGRPRHVRARRASTGTTRCASRSRSARRCRPTRSPAWRRTCASPGPRRWRRKIFGRLSAWQNWIFQRPNAVGEQGALTLYGKPERPEFDWKRT